MVKKSNAVRLTISICLILTFPRDLLTSSPKWTIASFVTCWLCKSITFLKIIEFTVIEFYGVKIIPK